MNHNLPDEILDMPLWSLLGLAVASFSMRAIYACTHMRAMLFCTHE